MYTFKELFLGNVSFKEEKPRHHVLSLKWKKIPLSISDEGLSATKQFLITIGKHETVLSHRPRRASSLRVAVLNRWAYGE